jgi:hypothetical protein
MIIIEEVFISKLIAKIIDLKRNQFIINYPFFIYQRLLFSFCLLIFLLIVFKGLLYHQILILIRYSRLFFIFMINFIQLFFVLIQFLQIHFQNQIIVIDLAYFLVFQFNLNQILHFNLRNREPYPTNIAFFLMTTIMIAFFLLLFFFFYYYYRELYALLIAQ